MAGAQLSAAVGHLFAFARTAAVATLKDRGGFVATAVVVGLFPLVLRSSDIGLPLLSDRWLTAAILAGVYAMLALGLLVVAGWAGQWFFGYAGLFAIGAYTYGLLNSVTTDLHVGGLITVPIAVTACVVVALLVGAPGLRVRGDHFALITVAFGESVRIVITNLRDITGGGAGLVGIDPLFLLPDRFGPSASSPVERFYVIWLVVLGVWFWLAQIRPTALGRSWLAVREDEEAGRSVGVPVFEAKLAALAVSAAAAGLAGVMFAAHQLALVPESFGLLASVAVLAALILGGVASPLGAVLGAVLIVAIPEVIREAGGGTDALLDYRMLIYGGALVAVILLRPAGIVPEQRLDLTAVGDGRGEESLKEGVSGAALDVSGVRVGYGGVVALNNVSFHARPGELVGLIGANGSGKTTLVNAISGFLSLSAGSIRLDGQRIDRWRAEERSRAGISRTFQMNRLFQGMSISENVVTAGDNGTHRPLLRGLVGTSAADRRAIARATASLARFPSRFGPERFAQLPASLSYANRRRLEIARALAAQPRLLLLDEPTAGMNPVDKRELLAQVREIASSGVTVIVIEHELGALATVADRLIALDHGVVLADGRPDEVLASPNVVDALVSFEGGRAQGSA